MVTRFDAVCDEAIDSDMNDESNARHIILILISLIDLIVIFLTKSNTPHLNRQDNTTTLLV